MVKKVKVYKQKQSQKQVVSIHIGDKGKKKVNRKRRSTSKVQSSSTSSSAYYQPYTPVYIQSGQAPHVPETNPLLKAIEELSSKVEKVHTEKPREHPLVAMVSKKTITEPVLRSETSTNTESDEGQPIHSIYGANPIFSYSSPLVQQQPPSASSEQEPERQSSQVQAFSPLFELEHPLLREHSAGSRSSSSSISSGNSAHSPFVTFNPQFDTRSRSRSTSTLGSTNDMELVEEPDESDTSSMELVEPPRNVQVSKRRGRPPKYATEEERRLAQVSQNRESAGRYYERRKNEQSQMKENDRNIL